jgi:membrane associated rhomboid family serine protease
VHTEEPVKTRLAVVRWLYLLSPLMLAWFVWTTVVTAPGFGLTGRPLVVGVATGVFAVLCAATLLPARVAVPLLIAAFLFAKIDARDRAQAVAYAFRHGLGETA